MAFIRVVSLSPPCSYSAGISPSLAVSAFFFFFLFFLSFASSFALPGRLCRSTRSFGPFFFLGSSWAFFLCTVPLLNKVSVGEGPAKAFADTLGRVLPAGGGPRTKTPKKKKSSETGPRGTGLAIFFSVLSVLRKKLRFFIFHGRPNGPSPGGSRRPFPGHSFFLFAPSGLCRPSLGCILLPLCPFGPLPSQPSAVYPFRGVVITVALRLPAHKNTHHGMRIPGRQNP